MTKEEQRYVQLLQNPYATLNYDESEDGESAVSTPVYEIGTFFKVLIGYHYVIHILAQVGSHKVALISLETGNRLTDAVEVPFIYKIPKEVIDQELAPGYAYEVMPVSWQFI